MRAPASVLAAALVAVLAAGCGDGASGGGSTIPAQTGSFPTAGVRFTPPAGWSVAGGSGNLVATVQAGQATVAIWRFPRAQALPTTTAQLKAARDALIKASAQHDASFTEIKTAPTTIAGLPAVQIRAKQTMVGQPRTVRSTHVYANGSEYVIDAYADADSFRGVDAQVFRPLLRSLRLTKPQGSA